MKSNPLSFMPHVIKFPVETRTKFRKPWQERMQPNFRRRMECLAGWTDDLGRSSVAYH